MKYIFLLFILNYLIYEYYLFLASIIYIITPNAFIQLSQKKKKTAKAPLIPPHSLWGTSN